MLRRFNKTYLHLVALCFLLLCIITFLLSESHNSVPKEDRVLNLHLGSEKEFTNSLFDISNFSFVIRPNDNYCNHWGNSTPKAIFIVTSHLNNVEVRSAMRRAFPKSRLDQHGLLRVFLLGITPDNQFLSQKAIFDESRRYGDIVQGNFLEAYKNLTYKHIMGLRWIAEYCKNTHFVIKMDDDIVVNVLKMLDVLKRFNYQEEFIRGYILSNQRVKRDRANKWYVSQEEYLPETYPDFVSGWLYVTTPKVCRKLGILAGDSKYFWIDDVYVTGLLVQKIDLKMYDIKELFTDHPQYFQCCMDDLIKYNFDCDVVVGPNGGRTNLFYEFNTAFSKCVRNVCDRRTFPVDPICIGKKNSTLENGSAVISIFNLS